MATADQQRAYKDAVARGDQRAASSALNDAMRTSWDSMSREGQAELRNQSGSLWESSPARLWDEENQQRSLLAEQARQQEEIRRQQEALLQAQKQKRIDALSAARASGLSALGAEASAVSPMYNQQRAQLGTSSAQQGRSFREFAAQRGLASSGASAQEELARNVALQQGLTGIGTAEAGTLANIERRKTEAEQAYQSGVAQAESDTAATAAQNEIQRLMQAQEAQQSAAAMQASQQWEAQKTEQEQANKMAIEQLRIAAQEANAQGDFTRAQELAKYKNDLEAETIKLRSSLEPKKSSGSGSGGSSTSTKVPTAYTTGAKNAIAMQPNASIGEKQAIINSYAKQMRANGFTEAQVQAFLIQMGMGTSTLAGAPASNQYDRNTLMKLQQLGIE